MQRLVQGIHHFQENNFRERADWYRDLARGQTPLAFFVTCCDSRINPNLITNTQPGELFLLRNIGNLIPPFGAAGGGEDAAIEYAIEGLGIKDIIICGHTGCGAMNGLLNPDAIKELPGVVNWLRHAQATRRIIETVYPDLLGEDRLTAAAEENVLVQLENLRTHPVVAAGLAKGELKLHGWMYKIATGQIFAFEPARGQFVDTAESPKEPESGIARRAGTGSNGNGHRHAEISEEPIISRPEVVDKMPF